MAMQFFYGLPRVMPLTKERAPGLVCCYATSKLDGLRAALVCEEHGCFSVTSTKISRVCDGIPGGRSVLDCELVDGTFHVFDAPEASGVDVRLSTLPERLDAATRVVARLPRDLAKMKSYCTGRGNALALLGLPGSDGIILGDLTDAYDTPPLKFKTSMTCDFALESSANHSHVLLMGRSRGCLEVLWVDGEVQRVRLPFPLQCDRRSPVIAECRYDTEERGWWFVRMRPDRREPNRVSVVKENLALDRSGCLTPAWLHDVLAPRPLRERAKAFAAALWRAVLANEQGPVRLANGARLPEACKTGAASEGSRTGVVLVSLQGRDLEAELTKLREVSDPSSPLVVCGLHVEDGLPPKIIRQLEVLLGESPRILDVNIFRTAGFLRTRAVELPQGAARHCVSSSLESTFNAVKAFRFIAT